MCWNSLNLFTEVLPPASGQYVVTPIPYAPVACTSPTTLSLSDDQVSAAIPIGFPFLFYGNTYTDIYVSSNGFVTFNPGSASGCCAGEDLYVDNSLFDPTNLIALAWNDLNPNSGGTISYCIEGSAPNRRFIIDYSGVPHFGGGQGVTGQIILYEGTGVIDIISSDIINDGGNMTQGIQNNTLLTQSMELQFLTGMHQIGMHQMMPGVSFLTFKLMSMNIYGRHQRDLTTQHLLHHCLLVMLVHNT